MKKYFYVRLWTQSHTPVTAASRWVPKYVISIKPPDGSQFGGDVGRREHPWTAALGVAPSLADVLSAGLITWHEGPSVFWQVLEMHLMFIKVQESPSYFLLSRNKIISGCLLLFPCWWYKNNNNLYALKITECF